MGEKALEVVRRGEVSEQVIDDKVRRILSMIEKAGLFEQPVLPPEQGIDQPEHRRVAREAASEALVLLKNDRPVLPLDPDKTHSIAVIGEQARWASITGGGSVRVTPHYAVAPLEAIRERVGSHAQVRYAVGCTIHQNLPHFDKNWFRDRLTLQYFANRDLSGPSVHTETTDKTELIWFGNIMPYVDLDDFSARLTGAFSVPESGTYALSLASVGKSRVFVDDELVIDLWKSVPADAGQSRSAEIELTGGREYMLRVEYACEPGAFWRNLRIGAMPRVPENSIEQAADLAAKCDVALVFAGLTREWESEGFDRPDMELPGDQIELIERVAAANPNTVVVLTCGAPVSMTWLDKVPAVVYAAYLGQETGHAIADVLFGDVNPSGKLPTTWPKRLQDNPAFINYPGENGQVLYGEGIFVGYRYYDKKEVEPLFPFGHGLSYTTFAYRGLRLGRPEYAAGEAIRLSVEVENTGTRAGQETIQVYVRETRSRLVRPEKELKAFAKVLLAPGETRTVQFVLNEEALAYYNPARKQWVAETGEFQVLVGSSSRAFHLTGSFHYRGRG
jgi:beta-glucosidase